MLSVHFSVYGVLPESMGERFHPPGGALLQLAIPLGG
jgi:hypothetical protein